MYRVSVGAPFGLRCVAGLVATLLLLVLATDQADARPRKRGFIKRTAPSAAYEPRYADIVVDANTGDVLHASNGDSQRHPASLTKIMTLYLLFERIAAGKLKLDTPLTVSANATTQAPSKLGLREGAAITVEDAIKALVTKSANDIAVVVAETIGGSEEEFAKLMTRKARALRMSRTVYKNASGLPDDDQVTTARDQALLALAIQDRFPRYYRYFATESFAYRGLRIRNHNRLLGRVAGVDGIKTGYTRASGFNLVTSVKRGNRHIVAVVFGGKSAGQRDARMRELIEQKVVEASAKRTAPKVAEAAEPAEPQKPMRLAAAGTSAAAKPESAKPDLAKSEPAKTESARKEAAASAARIEQPAAARAVPAPGTIDPIKPRLVKTLSVKPGSVPLAVAPLALLSPEPITAQAPAASAPAKEESLPPPPAGARPGVLGILPVRDTDTAMKKNVAATELAREAPAVELVVSSTSAKPAAPPRDSRPRSGWIIQVGAFPDEGEAKQRLASAKSKAAALLGKADPFTEPVTKGDQTLYRARFAGLKPEQAEAACRQLKRNDIACIAIRN